MDKDKTVTIPEGATATKENTLLVVSGPKGELRREFRHPNVGFEVKDRNIVVSTKSERRKDGAVLGTWASHIANMATGVTKGWEGRLKVVHSHFPIKVSVEDNKVLIQNFLGERKPRSARIIGDTKVDIKKDEIVVTGADKEAVGQTCGNIERRTRVTGRDKRVFMDGIYITDKPKPIEEE